MKKVKNYAGIPYLCRRESKDDPMYQFVRVLQERFFEK